MVFSFRFGWFCNSKHTEGVPMAQLFATGIYTTIWALPAGPFCITFIAFCMAEAISLCIKQFV